MTEAEQDAAYRAMMAAWAEHQDELEKQLRFRIWHLREQLEQLSRLSVRWPEVD